MLSFAIPAHNEEAALPATLSAIHHSARALNLPDYEIIVADDASTDRTADIARQAGARVISIDRRQIAAARNAAARASTGQVIFFLDADTLINPEALEHSLAALRAGAAGGGCMPRFDGAVPLWAHLLLPVIIALFRLLRLSGGAAMFCTRDAFDAAGGFDETLFASEEITFAQALKRHGRFVIPRARVITSGRKLRAYSAAEIFGSVLKLAIRGRKVVQSRDALDIWYAPRRHDPLAPIAEPTQSHPSAP